MQANNLSKQTEEQRKYVSPVVRTIVIDPTNVICESSTENVGEVDGEW